MFKKHFALWVVFIMGIGYSNAQTTDTLKFVKQKKVQVRKTIIGKEQHYQFKDSSGFVYKKPKLFSFITNLPKDAGGMVMAPFEKGTADIHAAIIGSTVGLIIADQPLIEGVGKLSEHIHLSDEGIYNDVFKIKLGKTDVKIIRLPGNLNTALYQLGQGFPSLLLGGGLYIYGKIKNDYRSISTASQLAESFFLMGISTQIIKRVSGRESPFVATADGGKWRPLPSFSNYQNHTPQYDAFPSGHLATMMSSVTIFAENYPEKKYIKPVGYSLIGLVGFAMMNNQVHWASDYPLALALGYLCAKQVAKNNRQKLQGAQQRKRKTELNYTLSQRYGVFMPGIVLNF